jgi:transcriptional regulator with XRE-family HTH domain
MVNIPKVEREDPNRSTTVRPCREVTLFMQPVPPAALQLAQRLRQLRQGWHRLTQEKLAAALGTEEPLSAVTVSSWESLKTPKLPPSRRLDAYARFFATRRSFDEEQDPKLFTLDGLTPDEKHAYEKLEAELVRLRGAATGESTEEEITFSRSWHFPDAGRITFICAELPDKEIGPFGQPDSPNYTELQRYADIDALMELHGHIRAENPTATVHFRTPPEVVADDLTGHVVLLGGVAWNDVAGRLAEMAELPVRQVTDAGLETGDIFVAQVQDAEHEFWPRWADEDKTVLAEDVGMFARVPNPLNAGRTLTICNGIHSRGVYGAVRTLTDAELRDGNERYISTHFADAESFAILMGVKVIKNKAITPDFNSPNVVLYEWTPSAL